MIKPQKYYHLTYYSDEWHKWLNIRFEMGELDKVRQFITRGNIKQYKLNMVEIKLHSVELGGDI